MMSFYLVLVVGERARVSGDASPLALSNVLFWYLAVGYITGTIWKFPGELP